MPQPIAVVDAFTAVPYRGNPAGVCLLSAPAADAWMQAVAIEMNHAETAFLLREGGDYSLRWFTPGGEVDLCGHATLASAHYLWESDVLPHDRQARFHTRSGLLTAEQRSIDGATWIELDFSAEPATPIAASPALAGALGTDVVWVGRNRMDYLVELRNETAVRSVRPDMKAIAELSVAADLRGVIVTAQAANGDTDIVSRCFYPRLRIDEDPVTGSAHCALAPYWMGRLGRQQLHAYQASPRGGKLLLELADERVRLRGQAVTTLRGELAHGPQG